MGWLREMMEVADPPLGSYGVLAERCLRHPGWPAGIRPKPRSLAALFSKFDRSIELEWLADRESVQRVLALLLGRSLSELQAHLETALRGDDARQLRHRFFNAPQARPLHLLEEVLPPGFPELVTAPRRWTRQWWQVHPGEAVEMVAAWLEARELAHVVRAEPDSELRRLLDPHGPNLVLLPAQFRGTWPSWLANVCVVAPAAPSEQGWELITSPAPSDFMQPLTQWLAPRLPADGRFDPELALEWLQANANFANDFESILGLLALLDEVGGKAVREQSLHALAVAFVKRRIVKARVDDDVFRWIDQNAFELLVGLAKRCVTDSDQPFNSPRTREEWLALVPPEFERGVDVEWAKVSLASAGTPVSVEELERALSRIPPGAFRALQALEAARLLVGNETLRPGPRWLTKLAQQRAERGLLASSSYEWGEGLLRGHAGEGLRQALLRRFLDEDYEAIENALEHDEPNNPAAAIALETLTETLGLSLLYRLGAAPLPEAAELEELALPPETLLALWQQQNKQLVRFASGELRSRFGGVAPRAPFLLAVWALAEHLEQSGLEAQGALNPTTAGLTFAELRCVLSFLQQSEPAPWVYAAFGVVGRWLSSGAEHPTHPLFAPWALNRSVRWPRLAQLAELVHGVAALHFFAAARGEWPKVAASLWTCWRGAGFPETALFEPTQSWAELLWAHVPVEVLRALLEQQHRVTSHPPYGVMPPAAKGTLLALAKTLPRSVYATFEPSLLPELLTAAYRLKDRDGIFELCQRFGDAVTEQIVDRAEHLDIEALSLLLDAAPPGIETAMVATVKAVVERFGVAHPTTDVIRRFLLRLCAARSPGFRDAYQLLDAIEQRLERVERAQGR